MAEQSLVRRGATALVRTIKAATRVVFPGYTNTGMGTFGGWFGLNNWAGGQYPGSEVNYRAKVGDASLSSLVMTVVNWGARRLPEAKLQVLETDAEDNDSPMVSHPLLKLLQRPTAPFPYYSGWRLWAHFMFSKTMDGNVYWWLIRNNFGQIIQIWPLPFWLVTPRWESEYSFIDYYEYVPNGTPIRVGNSKGIPPEDILHFRFGPDDPENNRKAMSELRSQWRNIASDNERESFYAALMANFGVPPMVVSFKETQAGLSGTDGQKKLGKLQDDLQRKVSGDQRGKIMVITYPLEIKQLAFDPKSLDLREAGYMSEDRFCAVIGIDGIELGLGTAAQKATYSNKETSIKQNAQNWLVPTWGVIADEITVQLLGQPQFQALDNQRCEYDLSKVAALQEDEDKKRERNRKDVLAGILQVFDAQVMNGWPGDEKMKGVYLRPKGLVEIRDGKAVPDAQPVPMGQPGQPIDQLGQPIANPQDSQQPRGRARLALVKSYLPLEHAFPHAIKAKHYFSSTQVDITGAHAKAMLKFASGIPDTDLAKDGREDNKPHITTLYGLATNKAADVKAVVDGFGPVTITFGKTDYFASPDANWDVVYVAIESDDLIALNQLLTDSLEYTATRSEYVPHATLAYVKAGLGKEYAGKDFLLGQAGTFDTLVFSSKNGVRTEIALGKSDEAAKRWAKTHALVKLNGVH